MYAEDRETLWLLSWPSPKLVAKFRKGVALARRLGFVCTALTFTRVTGSVARERR